MNGIDKNIIAHVNETIILNNIIEHINVENQLKNNFWSYEMSCWNQSYMLAIEFSNNKKIGNK